MMKLVNEEKGETFTILGGKKYSVGRKGCDLTFTDDQSISRKHAEIEIDFPRANLSDPSLTPTLNVTDLGSKFGTFINIGGQGNEAELCEISMREAQCMVSGDTIRFGRQWNAYRIRYTPLIVLGSALNDDDKKNMKDTILKLCGHFVPDWTENCNYVVMNTVTLTSKAVCGLLAGAHIVTPKYFQDYLSAVENKEPLPVPRDYEPPLGERNLPTTGINIQPMPSRSKLFVGKTFVFFNSPQAKKLSSTITCGGGKSKLLKSCDEAFLESPESLLFQPPTGSYQDKDIQKRIDTYKKSGKRLIAEADVSLAALYASVTKYCNPYHNISQQILPAMTSQTQSSQSKRANTVIVPETQPSEHPSFHSDSRIVVEESLNMSTASGRSTASTSRSKISAPEDDGPPSAKRRLDVKSSSSSTVVAEPSPKRQKQSGTAQSGSLTASSIVTTRSKNKTLSQIFKLSDSEDDDDDDAIDTIPESQADPDSQSQRNKTNRSDVPAADFDFVGIRGKHLRSPNKNNQKVAASEEKKKNDEEVDFVPGTPDMSDEEENSILAGLTMPEYEPKPSSSREKNTTKRKAVDVVEDDDDDITVLPTVKLPTLAPHQFPTLAMSDGRASTRSRGKAHVNKTVEVKEEEEEVSLSSGKKKRGDLSSWLLTSKRKKDDDAEDENASTSEKRRRTTTTVDEKPEVKVEVKEEPVDSKSDILVPASIELTSMIRSLSLMTEKNGKAPKSNNKNVPNFKTFKKVQPLTPSNGAKLKPGSQKTGSKKTFLPPPAVKLVIADNDYIDSVNVNFEFEPQQKDKPSQQLVQSAPTVVVQEKEKRRAAQRRPEPAPVVSQPVAGTSGTRMSGRTGRQQRNSPMVVDVDPEDVASPTFTAARRTQTQTQKTQNSTDPSEGLFDF